MNIFSVLLLASVMKVTSNLGDLLLVVSASLSYDLSLVLSLDFLSKETLRDLPSRFLLD